jgi:periplasmic divalent cation tolerance protein
MRRFVQLVLTCKDQAEADTIAFALLDGHLIACAKSWPATSTFWWQGKQESENEILLLMDSAEELFDEVSALVRKHHSYDTFNLQALAVARVTDETARWMEENLKKANGD